MFDLEKFKEQYQPDISEVSVKGKRFQFYVPSDIEPLLDPSDPMNNFPLWAKIWEPSLVLAHHMATLPADPPRICLEIGAGLGVVGIVAASFGHRVTITEYDGNALRFIKANTILNKLPEVKIEKLDWHKLDLDGRYDIIFGSEVVYRKEDYNALMALFRAYLNPNGLIFLAEGIRRTTMEFLQRLSEGYTVKAKKKVLRSQEEEISMLLCEIRPK